MRYGYLLSEDVQKDTITSKEYEEIEALVEGACTANTKLKAKPYINKLMVKCTYFRGDLYVTCFRLIDTVEAASQGTDIKRLHMLYVDILMNKMKGFIKNGR